MSQTDIPAPRRKVWHTFNKATAGFIISMALGVTTTVPWVVVDRGTRVGLIEVTDENRDIGGHGSLSEMSMSNLMISFSRILRLHVISLR